MHLDRHPARQRSAELAIDLDDRLRRDRARKVDLGFHEPLLLHDPVVHAPSAPFAHDAAPAPPSSLPFCQRACGYVSRSRRSAPSMPLPPDVAKGIIAGRSDAQRSKKVSTARGSTPPPDGKAEEHGAVLRQIRHLAGKRRAARRIAHLQRTAAALVRPVEVGGGVARLRANLIQRPAHGGRDLPRRARRLAAGGKIGDQYLVHAKPSSSCCRSPPDRAGEHLYSDILSTPTPYHHSDMMSNHFHVKFQKSEVPCPAGRGLTFGARAAIMNMFCVATRHVRMARTPRRCGGIGRRTALKMRRIFHAGSSPATGTMASVLIAFETL